MGSSRIGYLDWARGLAVLAMIHTHAVYAWTRPEDQRTAAFAFTRLIGGFPAGLFLFLAGLAAALVAEKERGRGADSGAVLARALRRGLLVLGFALAFRIWMFTTSQFARPADLLRVDVLNCIAVSLLLVALVLGAPSPRLRVASSIVLAAAVALLTPLAWDGGWGAGLPVALRGYWTGRVRDSIYPVFPWACFALLGAAAGAVLPRVRSAGREGAFIATLAAVGAAAIPAGLLADRHGPAVFPHYDFWYTSPSYTLLKIGVVLLVVAAAFVLDRIPGPSVLRQLGQTSLLVYWVHIEIVYGKWVVPWARQRLTMTETLLGVILLTAAMLALSLARTGRLPRLWRRVPATAGA